MEFRKCLTIITLLFWPNKKFDAESLRAAIVASDILTRLYRYNHLAVKEVPSQDGQRNWLEIAPVSTKIISNDLRRLNKMGFLTQRRVKRETRTVDGLVCHRGFKYVYSLSKQGTSYVSHLIQGHKKQQTHRGRKVLMQSSLAKMLDPKNPEQNWDLVRFIYDNLVEGEKRRAAVYQARPWARRKAGWLNRFPDKSNVELINDYVLARLLLARNGIDFESAKQKWKQGEGVAIMAGILEPGSPSHDVHVKTFVQRLVEDEPELMQMLLSTVGLRY